MCGFGFFGEVLEILLSVNVAWPRVVANGRGLLCKGRADDRKKKGGGCDPDRTHEEVEIQRHEGDGKSADGEKGTQYGQQCEGGPENGFSTVH